jgi:hypothetical protein
MVRRGVPIAASGVARNRTWNNLRPDECVLTT